MKTLILSAIIGVIVGVFTFSPSVSPQDPGQYFLTEKAPHIVKLTPPSRTSAGGTGFELRAPSGTIYTVTNGHVCELAEGGYMRAFPQNSDRSVFVQVLEVSLTTDLCVLTGLPGAISALEMSEQLLPYEPLYVLGHPLLKPITFASGYAVSAGEIHLLEIDRDEATCVGPSRHMEIIMSPFGPVNACVRSVRAVDTSIIIYGGNSGSPVMNRNGDVVGVIFAATLRNNHGAMVPLEDLRAFLADY